MPADQPELSLGAPPGDPFNLSMRPLTVDLYSADLEAALLKVKALGGRCVILRWDKKRGNAAWTLDLEWKR